MPEELVEPLPVDVVEIADHIDLDDVLDPVLHHPLPESVQRRVRAPPRAETMRAIQEVLLEDGRQHPGYGLPDHPIFNSGDAQRPSPAIGLRDVRPSHYWRSVAASL
jgi:hypothetical protein